MVRRRSSPDDVDVAVTVVKAIDKESELPPAAPPIEVTAESFEEETAGPGRGARSSSSTSRRPASTPSPSTGSWAAARAGARTPAARRSCARPSIAAARAPEWRTLMTAPFTAGRHSFTVTLAGRRRGAAPPRGAEEEHGRRLRGDAAAPRLRRRRRRARVARQGGRSRSVRAAARGGAPGQPLRRHRAARRPARGGPAARRASRARVARPETITDPAATPVAPSSRPMPPPASRRPRQPQPHPDAGPERRRHHRRRPRRRRPTPSPISGPDADPVADPDPAARKRGHAVARPRLRNGRPCTRGPASGSGCSTGRAPCPRTEAEARTLVAAAAEQGLAGLLHADIVAQGVPWPRDTGRRPPRSASPRPRAGGPPARRRGRVRRCSCATAASGRLPLKGAALAERLYDSVGHRPMADVDILALDDWPASVRALRDAGFRDGRGRRTTRGASSIPSRGRWSSSITASPRARGSSPWTRRGCGRAASTAAGQVARVPAVEDLLVQLSLHAAFQHGLVLTLVQYLDFRRLFERMPPDAGPAPRRADRSRAPRRAGRGHRGGLRRGRAPRAPRTLRRRPGARASRAASARRDRGRAARSAASSSRPPRPALGRVRWALAARRRADAPRRALSAHASPARRAVSITPLLRAGALAWRWGPADEPCLKRPPSSAPTASPALSEAVLRDSLDAFPHVRLTRGRRVHGARPAAPGDVVLHRGRRRAPAAPARRRAGVGAAPARSSIASCGDRRWRAGRGGPRPIARPSVDARSRRGTCSGRSSPSSATGVARSPSPAASGPACPRCSAGSCSCMRERAVEPRTMPPISLSDAFTRSDRMVGRRVADEYILVPIVGHGAELDGIYNLSRVGAFIWELLDGRHSGEAGRRSAGRPLRRRSRDGGDGLRVVPRQADLHPRRHTSGPLIWTRTSGSCAWRRHHAGLLAVSTVCLLAATAADLWLLVLFRRVRRPGRAASPSRRRGSSA